MFRSLKSKATTSPASRTLRANRSVHARGGNPMRLHQTLGNQATLQVLGQRVPQQAVPPAAAHADVSDAVRAAADPAHDAAMSNTNPSASLPAPNIVGDALSFAGEPLDSGTRAFFEPRFAHDLSDVRVHTGATAAQSAEAVDAHAYTVGRSIVFGAGRYAPRTETGRKLLAHELTHVVQQSAGAAGAALRRQPKGGRRGFAAGDLVTAKIPFALMDRLGGEPGQKKVKQIEAGDLLRVEADLSGGAALAYRLTVMKNATDPETDARGNVEVGVASVHWIKLAPPAPTAAPAKPKPEPTSKPALDPAAIAAARQKRRDEIQAIKASDIRANWSSRRDDFIAVASDPANTLSALQMYQIWLRFWMDRQKAAYKEYHRQDDALRAADIGSYVPKKMDFDIGKRKALGPEYEAAADKLDTANYLLSDLIDVHDWLENWVDGAGHHVTLQRVNEKTVEILRARAWFLLFMEPVILGAAAAAELPAGRGAGARSGLDIFEPVEPAEPVEAEETAPKAEPPKPKAKPPKAKPRVEAVPERALSSAERLARDLVAKLVQAGKKVVVNIGGAGAAHEPPDAINVNNQVVSRKGIPNLVEADGSDVGDLFDPATVDRIEGHNMAPEAIDWGRAAPGAFKVLKSGGTLKYYYRGACEDANFAGEQLRKAGFKDVKVTEEVIVEATKP